MDTLEATMIRSDRQARSLVVPLAVLLVTFLLVRFVLFQFATVSGDSMRPALHPEDHLMLTRGYPIPKRGDIVVFKSNERGLPIEIVKRVIAMPGDTVMTKGDKAWVNGRPESKDFVTLTGDSQRVVGPVKVPPGDLFVLGDNRIVSLDSRFIGMVPIRSVIGRAMAVFSPNARLQLLPGGS